jgi:cold shock CspA family protein
MKGVIKILKRSKPGQKFFTLGCGVGYGFIQDEAGQDRFFSHSNVVGTTFDKLREGLTVEFEPISVPGRGRNGSEGLRADHVTVVQ